MWNFIFLIMLTFKEYYINMFRSHNKIHMNINYYMFGWSGVLVNLVNFTTMPSMNIIEIFVGKMTRRRKSR